MKPKLTRTAKIGISFVVFALFIVGTYGLAKRAAGSIWAEAGFDQLNNGNYSQAVQDFSRATNMVPYNPSYNFLYGQSLYQLASRTRDDEIKCRFLEEAQMAYQEAVKLNPLESRGWAGLARANAWLAQLKNEKQLNERALEYLDKALKLDPNNGWYRYYAVQFSLYTGDWAKAVENMEKLAKTSPLKYFDISFPGWKGRGRDLFQGSLSAAAKNQLINIDALSVLAFIAAEKKQWPQAVAYMNEMITRSPINQRRSLLVRMAFYQLKCEDKIGAKMHYLKH